MDPILSLAAVELSDHLARGVLTSEALVRACIARADAVDPQVRAFLARDDADALAQARASDARRAAGQARGSLDGIPVAIKDVIAVAGQPLTCASRMLEKFVSPYDATVIQRLRAAGAVIWGRLNMDEFAMGSSTENSAYHTTCNPWNLGRSPGGSSGGSAAAVAAACAPLALGSDTGGSIRQPASFCGVTGMKPTYGRVSRYGLVAFASSLDQIGPFGRTVEDCALALNVLCGADEHDSTSAPQPVPDFLAEARQPLGRLRLGLPREFLGEGLDPEVRAVVERAVAHYRAAGHEVVEISLPNSQLAVPVYYIVATAEASSNLARFDGVRYGHRSEQATDILDLYFKSRGEGFGPEVKRRIILGTYVLSSGFYDAFYLRAQKVRTLIRDDYLRAFQTVDAIIGPTAPTPAFRHGAHKDDPLAMYLADIYTIATNLAGLPALSIPAGFSREGLPIGLQFIGKPFDEAGLLRAARCFESAHDYARRLAPLTA